MLTRTIMGHVFGVEVSEARDAGELANGARAHEAQVAFFRDGACVGSGRWDGEGFAECQNSAGGSMDLFPDGDENDAYYALATEVRSHLARRGKPERVEPNQPWRCAGEDRELEVASVDSEEATLRVRALGTGEWLTWGAAPVDSMLTLTSWTFPGNADGHRRVQGAT